MSTLPGNSYSWILLGVICLIFTTGCSPKKQQLEPLYGTKKVYRPLTFGPGMHNEVIVYKNVKGWTDGSEPDWISCESIGGRYLELISEHGRFENEKVKMYTFFGKTWISSFIKFDNQKDVIFRITEWDDHSNYKAIDVKKLVDVMCQR